MKVRKFADSNDCIMHAVNILNSFVRLPVQWSMSTSAPGVKDAMLIDDVVD